MTLGLLKETWARFNADNATILAAALGYTVVFAIAPLMIVAIGVAGGLLGVANGGHGHHVIENQLIAAVRSSAGPAAATMVRTMVDTGFSSHQGSTLAQTIGWATFLLAASGLFLTVQTSLNLIWRAQPHQRGMWLTLRNRLASAAMLVILGILLLATLALNVAISFLSSHLAALFAFPQAGALTTVANDLVDVAVVWVMFALTYKVLPDATVAWRDVWMGALVTAVLFVAGEALLGIYLSHAGIANGYGAAGSLVVLLVWAYYSAMLFLIGAEFTRVFAERHGSLAARA